MWTLRTISASCYAIVRAFDDWPKGERRCTGQTCVQQTPFTGNLFWMDVHSLLRSHWMQRDPGFIVIIITILYCAYYTINNKRRCISWVSKTYKKDGYRQQNVCQRQKLISIIDYDVCILEYLQPFWRFSTSKNGLTLKSGYGILQGHWKRRGSIHHVWLSISPPL